MLNILSTLYFDMNRCYESLEFVSKFAIFFLKEPKEPEIGLTAKRGTLKRKQQLRELVDHSNKLYQEDLFDGTPYRHHSKVLSNQMYYTYKLM